VRDSGFFGNGAAGGPSPTPQRDDDKRNQQGPLDNVEGMTLGPTLPDGRRSLILVSDHNFAGSQFTQFLLFALARS
jgi:hypothetical protein